MPKFKYRVSNWSNYNRSLKNRGNVEFYIDTKMLNNFYAQKGTKNKKGRPKKYNSALIECALTLKIIFNLGFRQTMGFMEGLAKTLGLNQGIPDYTTICKRQREVDTTTLSKHRNRKKIYLALDSSGLKVYGEGEWKVRQHGYSKRRTWRKLHIGIGIGQAGTINIEAIKLTKNNVHDSKIAQELIDQVEGEIVNILGDGAYDTKSCHKAAKKRKAKMIAPPCKGAITKFKDGKKHPDFEDRNNYIREIHKNGMAEWKRKSKYHKRSLVENAFYRIKTILGDKLVTRKFENQEIEAFLKCKIINKMTAIGMPKSVAVEAVA